MLFIDGPSDLEHRQWLIRCCAAESRCTWLEQDPNEPGIFGAMNQGFSQALPSDWLLFWGSDDWAASPNVLEEVFSTLEVKNPSVVLPDLLVCRGRYVDQKTASLSRFAVFHSAGSLTRSAYRRALIFGSTPPHQATLFGPRARQFLDHYSPVFRLSADLDYFLQISSHADLCVKCLNIELVHMFLGGVSGVQTKRRLSEVCLAYRRAFGLFWPFPFLMRYLRRFISLLPSWK